jgi:hypothetical protein
MLALFLGIATTWITTGVLAVPIWIALLVLLGSRAAVLDHRSRAGTPLTCAPTVAA